MMLQEVALQKNSCIAVKALCVYVSTGRNWLTQRLFKTYYTVRVDVTTAPHALGRVGDQIQSFFELSKLSMGCRGILEHNVRHVSMGIQRKDPRGRSQHRPL